MSTMLKVWDNAIFCAHFSDLFVIKTGFFIVFIQGKDSSSFEDVWPTMRPIVLKVLKQEPVTQSEWQELFYGVHLICLWDEKGASKIYECLQEDIVAFIKQAQARVLAQREEQALLKAYIVEWRKFFTQSSYLPLPFRQLETGLQVNRIHLSR